LKVLIDKYVPYVAEALAPIAEVVCLEPEAITPERVRDADALIIRTRTRCDAALLAGSRVRFIATATIGYDHIDTTYCDQHHIHWTNCPGCNSQAVCDYLEEALTSLLTPPSSNNPLLPSTFYLLPTIGIVGVGHVGTKVAAMASRLGYQVLLNDPPKGIGVSLDEIARQCDIITFHTPLDAATYHLCSATFLQKCKPHALIINAARGGIVDEQALLQSGHPYVIDCWENEPHIDPRVCLSKQALLCSYHIAGYSQEGKKNASEMCLTAFCNFFGLSTLKIEKKVVPLHADSAPGWLMRVSDQLKAHPEQFEQLRKNYILR